VFPVQAPESQPVFFDDVEAEAKSMWRGGMDQFHDPDDFANVVVRLREKEVEDFKLAVEVRNGIRCLVTTRALKEFDVVGVAPAMLFSTPGLMRDFMNCGGNVPMPSRVGNESSMASNIISHALNMH
jgi:hypothetical protein